MLNKRYIKSIKRDNFVLISFPVFLFQFLFCYILERKDKKWFKRDIIVLISFLILFDSGRKYSVGSCIFYRQSHVIL